MFNLTYAPVDARRPPPLDPASPDIELWRDNDGTICAYGGSLDGACWMHLPDVATFRFSHESGQITAFADASAARGQIADAYYRTVLPLALQARGIEVLHASAVRMHGGIVALCGIKETGKSTIAYALSQRGYSLCADDAVPFTTSGDMAHALSLPFTTRLRPSSAAFFETDGTRERQSPLLDARTPVALAPERLAAVLVLQRNPAGLSTAPPSVSRLTASSAFTSALTHAYCFSLRDESQRARMVQHYLDLAARVPVFEVRFGAGLDWLPAITSAIEEAVAAAA
ncbi:MAG TPA: hypothetical protein VES88_04510 [Gemmatimonadaceae bacterium]|nr:hypothetical protein [Gemmatimonadaceae bacterium]